MALTAMGHRVASVVLVIGLIMLGGCSDGRPDERQAISWFKRVCFDAHDVDVHIAEDEVTARSFEFTYRKNAVSELEKIEIQFMAIDGSWKPQPPIPETICR